MRCQQGPGLPLKVSKIKVCFKCYYDQENSLKVNFLIQGEDEPKPGITTAAEVPGPAWKPEVVSYS